jgi:hypothetical protein
LRSEIRDNTGQFAQSPRPEDASRKNGLIMDKPSSDSAGRLNPSVAFDLPQQPVLNNDQIQQKEPRPWRVTRRRGYFGDGLNHRIRQIDQYGLAGMGTANPERADVRLMDGTQQR